MFDCCCVSEQVLVLVGLVLGKMMLSQLSVLLSKEVFKFAFCLLWCLQPVQMPISNFSTLLFALCQCVSPLQYCYSSTVGLSCVALSSLRRSCSADLWLLPVQERERHSFCLLGVHCLLALVNQHAIELSKTTPSSLN